MNDAFETLAALRRTLTDGVEALEREGGPSEVWKRCTERFQAVDLVALVRDVDPRDHPRLRNELEELLRLNAVVSSAAGRERGRLEDLLDQAQRARKSIAYYAPGERTGSACDLSG